MYNTLYGKLRIRCISSLKKKLCKTFQSLISINVFTDILRISFLKYISTVYNFDIVSQVNISLKITELVYVLFASCLHLMVDNKL